MKLNSKFSGRSPRLHSTHSAFKLKFLHVQGARWALERHIFVPGWVLSLYVSNMWSMLPTQWAICRHQSGRLWLQEVAHFCNESTISNASRGWWMSLCRPRHSIDDVDLPQKWLPKKGKKERKRVGHWLWLAKQCPRRHSRSRKMVDGRQKGIRLRTACEPCNKCSKFEASTRKCDTN